MNGRKLKSYDCWGFQHGLLSADEIDCLMSAVVGSTHILEVGHYYGLSTCAIVGAMQSTARHWSLVSVDAHIPDAWVPESLYAPYLANKIAHFNDPRVMTLIQRSEAITQMDGFDTLFYDGDHGEEQMRFITMAAETESMRMIIYDDRDFEVPSQCSEYLRRAGWREHSLPTRRLEDDKDNPNTMTLAIFTKG